VTGAARRLVPEHHAAPARAVAYWSRGLPPAETASDAIAAAPHDTESWTPTPPPPPRRRPMAIRQRLLLLLLLLLLGLQTAMCRERSAVSGGPRTPLTDAADRLSGRAGWRPVGRSPKVARSTQTISAPLRRRCCGRLRGCRLLMLPLPRVVRRSTTMSIFSADRYTDVRTSCSAPNSSLVHVALTASN